MTAENEPRVLHSNNSRAWAPEYGDIAVTTHLHPITGDPLDFDYKWIGPPKTLVQYTGWIGATHHIPQDLHPGQTLTFGPYRLRVIDNDYMRGSYVCYRDGARAWVALYQTTLARHARYAYHRLIATAGVWGLATWHTGTIPTWRDGHLLRRFAAWIGRAR